MEKCKENQLKKEERKRNAREFLLASEGGCSAMSWETEDGLVLWGRNFDFNRIAKGTNVLYVPADIPYDTCGGVLPEEKTLPSKKRGKYAAIGIGGLFLSDTPLFYEGMNEEGLMGGQLYFRKFAAYPKNCQSGRIPVQPSVLLTHVLLQCKDTKEVEDELKNRISLVDLPILGTVVQVHWMFTDRRGRSIVVEERRDGLHVYPDTMGIMTNSPDYEWHRLNILNYVQIRQEDYGIREFDGERVEPCFSGSGTLGLPGDFTSPSRFVRLAFLKKYGVKGKNEKDGVTRLFHMMHHAAFPPGLAVVGEPGENMPYDERMVPYDYTIYTSVMCAQSGRFYWTTFENMNIRCAALADLKERQEPVQLELNGRDGYSQERVR